MTWIEAALWGMFGGFAVEGLDLYGAVRRRGCWPWRARGPQEVGAAGYFVAELVRLVIGSGLALASVASSQVTTAFGALAVGVAAPLIVERLTRAIPLTGSVQDAAGVTTDEWRPTASETKLNGQRTSVEDRPATCWSLRMACGRSTAPPGTAARPSRPAEHTADHTEKLTEQAENGNRTGMASLEDWAAIKMVTCTNADLRVHGYR
jgi:hypothetical protein